MQYLRLDEVLSSQGRSQTWLADQLGISKNAVNGLVNHRSYPSLKRLHEIAGILGVDVAALLAQTNYVPPTIEDGTATDQT